MSGLYGGTVDRDRRETPLSRSAITRMNALLAVGSHLVAGSIEHNGLRLSDVLNDPLSDFVTVYEAKIFSAAGKLLNDCQEVVLPKSRLVLAAVPGVWHEAPAKRRIRHQAKKRYEVFLLAGRFAVRGTLHVAGTTDPKVMLKDQFGTFFAVQRAKVTNLYSDGRSISAQAAILRTETVSLMELGDEVRPEPKNAEASAVRRAEQASQADAPSLSATSQPTAGDPSAIGASHDYHS